MADPPPMRCPTCTTPLRPLAYEGVTLHTCDGCGGEFVGRDELARIVNIRSERFDPDLLQMLASRRPIFGIPAAEAATAPDCPACAGPMRTMNYAVDTGVFVDRCLACGGFWLDNAELEKIQALLERWDDEAPERLRAVCYQIAAAQERTASATRSAFQGSRFTFVNALINRFLDAA